ncbi:MAG: NEL-type E3 ubiquitin ligase domain-containing protein [Candidatus Rhabdochlamydia sp.]
MDILNVPPSPSFSAHRLPPNPRQVITVKQLSQITHLTPLSEKILIEGDLEICASNVRAFALLQSKDVEIKGSVACYDPSCFDILAPRSSKDAQSACSSFPKQLTIQGDLTLYGSSDLVLSERLEVKGSCEILESRGTAFTCDSLVVGKNLRFYCCTDLVTLSGNVQVGGSLDLSGSSQLKNLPTHLSVAQNLNLSYCASLTALPAHLTVGGCLNLSYCTELKTVSYPLIVSQDVTFHACEKLTSLPEGMQIGGSVEFSFCEALTTLPGRLEVKGNLKIEGCPNLIACSEGIQVGRCFEINDCPALQSILSPIEVKEDFKISGCPNVIAISDGLTVGGSCYIWGCLRLTHLPQDLMIGKTLNILKCHALVTLPKGMHIGSSLQISNCQNITTLPPGLTLKKDMNISECPHLLFLPEELWLGGCLFLSKCEALTTLSNALYIKKDASISYCPALIQLQGMTIGRSLYLSNCQALATLQNDLNIKEDLLILDCPALITLPEGLHLEGSLSICRCQALTTLPEHLRIRKNLYLTHCRALTTLPHQLLFGLNLSLQGCILITSLPHWIFTACCKETMRSVDLSYTALSDAIISRFKEMIETRPQIQLHFAREALESPPSHPENLLSALTFWAQQLPPGRSIDVPQIHQQLLKMVTQEQDQQNLLTFLVRLTETADFKNLATRTNLVSRLLHTLQLITQDQHLCESITFLIHQGLASCDDRVATLLDTIRFDLKLRELNRPDITAEELKQAGRGFFFFEELNKQIQSQIKQLPLVDEVEVYMAFHLRLQQMLNLPIDTKEMLFRRCVDLSDEKMDAIGAQVMQKAETDLFEIFLTQWDPWVQYQRRGSVLPFKQLPFIQKTLTAQDLCPYLQDTPTNPVFYHNVVYDYDAFIQRYIEKGVDAYGTQVNFTDLFRIEPS